MLFACSLMMIFPFFSRLISSFVACSHTHRNKDAQIKNEKETRKLVSEQFTRIPTKKRKKGDTERRAEERESVREGKENGIFGYCVQ